MIRLLNDLLQNLDRQMQQIGSILTAAAGESCIWQLLIHHLHRERVATNVGYSLRG